jgi:hypothetical protein
LELVEYFEERGYIDLNPTLDHAAIYACTIAAMETEVVAQAECVALADRLLGAFGVQAGATT